MKLNDAIFGWVLLALGAAVLWTVQGYPRIPGQQVGPALFPGIVAAALCVCGAFLVVRGWRARASQPWARAGEWARSPRHVLALCVVVLGVVFYIAASQWLGYLITAALLLFVLMWAFRVPPGRSLPIAVVAALVIHVAFYKLLRVPLPWGVLTPVAW